MENGSIRKEVYNYEENSQLIPLAKAGNQDAMNKVIEMNLPLVSSISKKFLNRGYDYEDIFQIGSIGLVKAINNFDEKLQQAEILIKCSKGTYIRSIAHDLGQKLNCGGYLIKLIRTQAGDFRIEDSIKLEDKIDVVANLINPIDKLNYTKYFVTDVELKKICHGLYIKNKDIKHGSIVILIYNKNEICAVGEAENGKIVLKKVFV